MRKALALGTAAAALVSTALAAPASAEGTVTTFELTGDQQGLVISVPTGTSAAPVHLGSKATGSATHTGNLGNVKVTDTRGSLTAAWTASVSATDFVTGTAPVGTESPERKAARTVSNLNIAYTSNAPLVPDLEGQVGTVTPSTGVTLGIQQVAASFAGVGNNQVTWNPTLTFTLLPSQVAGTYTGTVTHSVL